MARNHSLLLSWHWRTESCRRKGLLANLQIHGALLPQEYRGDEVPESNYAAFVAMWPQRSFGLSVVNMLSTMGILMDA